MELRCGSSCALSYVGISNRQLVWYKIDTCYYRTKESRRCLLRETRDYYQWQEDRLWMTSWQILSVNYVFPTQDIDWRSTDRSCQKKDSNLFWFFFSRSQHEWDQTKSVWTDIVGVTLRIPSYIHSVANQLSRVIFKHTIEQKCICSLINVFKVRINKKSCAIMFVTRNRKRR